MEYYRLTHKVIFSTNVTNNLFTPNKSSQVPNELGFEISEVTSITYENSMQLRKTHYKDLKCYGLNIVLKRIFKMCAK